MMLNTSLARDRKGTQLRSPKASMNPNPSVVMSIVVNMDRSKYRASQAYWSGRDYEEHDGEHFFLLC